MIGIVIVSHSSLIADGTKELALQMADPTLKIMAAGGTSDGKLGTLSPSNGQFLAETQVSAIK